MDTLIRDATPEDLPRVYDIYHADATGHRADVPPRPEVVLDIRHEFNAGSMVVAARGGAVVGFASSTTRDTIAFLSSLFVHPDAQSRRLGTAMLNYLLPSHSHICCTLSSSDPRALALYARFGMHPLWPNLLLQVERPRATPLLTPSAHVTEASADDEELLQWDAEICGRRRPIDHRYWVEEERAIPLWFSRWGTRIGYGYLRLGAGTFQRPDAAALGPIGARTAADALACTLSAVRWAATRVPVLRVDVPGPHPALAPLLEAGFRILDMDTFCLQSDTQFVDPRRYIGSGGSLY